MSLLDSEPVEAAHGDAGPGYDWCDLCVPPKRINLKNWARHRRDRHPEGEKKAAAPPRRDRQPAAPGSRSSSAGRKRSLRADLEVTYGLLAEFWRMRDPICGEVALQQVPKIALAWDTAAQNNARLHEALEKLMGGAGLAGVALAHAPIVMVVVAHHGPQHERYFPSAPPAEEAPTQEQPPLNGDGAWPQGGPVTGEYAPASADRAR